MYSWLRKSLTRINKEDTQILNLKNGVSKREEEDEYYGVTIQLIEFIKTFNFDTFKNFSLPEEQSDGIQTTSSGIRLDLSEWQQRHATMILSKVKDLYKDDKGDNHPYCPNCLFYVICKELSQLRYRLCPRHLKERQFWRIYFSLVKHHLTEYELRAIRLDKLRKMGAEDDEKSGTNAIELEMTEPKHMSKLESP